MISWNLIRLRPFDLATEGGRDCERKRRAGLTTLSSAFSRGAQLAVMFVSMKVALPYLGEVRFGVWMTISSLTTVLMIFDFGIGNGMVSRVAQLAAREDVAALKRTITSALAVLCVVGLIVGAALAGIAAYAPLNWAYKGASPAVIGEARIGLAILSVLFGLSIPLQAVHRIYAGLQEGYFALAMAGLASLISVLAIPVAPHLHWGIPGFLLVTYAVQLSSGLVLVIALQRRFRLTMPRPGQFGFEDVRVVLSSGGLFFLLQIGVVIGWEMDPLVLSAFVGPAAVAAYSVVQRMLLLVTGPLSMLNSPLWASYADAGARGDLRYLQVTLRRSLLGTFCLATAGVALVVTFHSGLVHFLGNGVLTVPQEFILIFGAWAIMSATGDALAMYMNGLHILFPQVVACIAFVLVAAVLKISLVRSYGLDGVILGTLISYLSTTVLLYLTLFRRRILAPLRGSIA